SADYHLTTNPNGGVTADMVTVSLQNDQWIGSIVLPANQESVTLYVMPDGDHIFENDETVLLTIIDAYAVSGFSFNISNSGGDVTIWQAPEFISDAEPAGTFNIPINFDVYNVPTVVFDTLDLDAAFFQVKSYHNRPVQYAIISGNDEGIFRIDADTGELFFTDLPTTLSVACTLMVRVEDAEYPLQYDMATVNIKGVSVEKAKEAIEQVYQECRNDLSWQFGTNTCQRFAFLFENKLRELRESDENVRLASNDSVVTYTLSGLISITSPKHTAVRIIFVDGSVLFYDNGAFGGIYTEHPDWATPDF
ncbi:MAG: cadherin repeat domain-containing protein, partial [Planctomycetaceae bacterium]|nr:cadherin repeat domain-containing protein [Planctomycetaceae bacterium]